MNDFERWQQNIGFGWGVIIAVVLVGLFFLICRTGIWIIDRIIRMFPTPQWTNIVPLPKDLGKNWLTLSLMWVAIGNFAAAILLHRVELAMVGSLVFGAMRIYFLFFTKCPSCGRRMRTFDSEAERGASTVGYVCGNCETLWETEPDPDSGSEPTPWRDLRPD